MIFQSIEPALKYSQLYASRYLSLRTDGQLFQVLLERDPRSEELPILSLDQLNPKEQPIGEEIHTLELPESFRSMNEILTSSGFYEMSPWWERTISRIYMFPRPRVVIRAGRRGGKSSMMARYTVHETLYGPFEAPKGDWLVYPLICQDRQTARDRLKACTMILEALGYSDKLGATRTTDLEIKFPDFRKTIRCVTCAPAAVVGMTCFGATGDEVTRWRDSNDREIAAEVLKSLAPSMLTMTKRGARLVLISSPMGQEDEHAKAFVKGTTPYQLAFCAPTWVANPSEDTTLEATRLIEPDEATWLREYGAIAMAAGLHQFFPSDLLRRAFGLA